MIIIVITVIIILQGERVYLALQPLLTYCTSTRWQMMVIVVQSVEWRLAGETEALRDNLPRRHFLHRKSHMT
jgi:hypothetical protein